VPVLDLVEQWVKDVLDNLQSAEDVYGTNIDAVENRPRDGFIPYTDGGFEGIGYASLSYAHGSGSAPAVIQPYIDQSVKDAEKEWDADNPEHTVAWIYGTDPEEQGQGTMFGRSTEREHWREKWYEFEDEWLSEGGTYFYKVRAIFFGVNNSRNQSGEPEVYFMVGINTDFEYGRDTIPWLACYGGNPKCTEWPWEKTIPVAQITPELVEKITEEATEALRRA
jgi:hypothetical protein